MVIFHSYVKLPEGKLKVPSLDLSFRDPIKTKKKENCELIGVAMDFPVPITSNGDKEQQLWTMSESKVFINAMKSVS